MGGDDKISACSGSEITDETCFQIDKLSVHNVEEYKFWCFTEKVEFIPSDDRLYPAWRKNKKIYPYGFHEQSSETNSETTGTNIFPNGM